MFFRKVKDAWDNKKDVLVKSGSFAIEQLSEALSATASSNKLPEGLPQNALRLCAEQVWLSIRRNLVFVDLCLCAFICLVLEERGVTLHVFLLFNLNI